LKREIPATEVLNYNKNNEITTNINNKKEKKKKGKGRYILPVLETPVA
jgi:hypothetical protein